MKKILLIAVVCMISSFAAMTKAEPSATYEWLGVEKKVIEADAWNEIPWGYIYPFEGDKWFYHTDFDAPGLGFLYPLVTEDGNTWFYSSDFDYVWTGLDIFSFLYLTSPGSWFYWLGVGADPGNWWVNMETGTWNNVPATAEPAAE